jgi:hypothetical protein
VKTSQPEPSARRRASIASTMHWLPNCSAVSFRMPGLFTAAVLSDTLSAPASSMRRTSAATRMPPPTVSGMKTWRATASTTCTMVSRCSWEAVMSRNVSSSAPCAS